MLSILIPVYNYPAYALVSDIHAQCKAADLQFEIVVAEDGSTKYLEENNAIGSIPNVRYATNTKNIGRSAIRNLLADMAKNDRFLFIDCDSKLQIPGFISRYLAEMEHQVVYGGTVYLPPEDIAFNLHYTYGVEREARSLHTRMDDPYGTFLTNNFMITRKVFQSIRFDESLKLYGFEDTLFAYELKRAGIKVTHIENPVIHAGLDNVDDFLEKTKAATENAWMLIRAGKLPADEIRFAEKYAQLKKFGVHGLTAAALSVYEPYFITYLRNPEPKLLYLDLLKLLWSHQVNKSRH